MKANLSKYTYFNGKRKIGGTAATLHFFKEHGGVDHVLEEVAKESALLAMQKLMVKVKK